MLLCEITSEQDSLVLRIKYSINYNSLKINLLIKLKLIHHYKVFCTFLSENNPRLFPRTKPSYNYFARVQNINV